LHQAIACHVQFSVILDDFQTTLWAHELSGTHDSLGYLIFRFPAASA
jgi:hypothetical protein